MWLVALGEKLGVEEMVERAGRSRTGGVERVLCRWVGPPVLGCAFWLFRPLYTKHTHTHTLFVITL